MSLRIEPQLSSAYVKAMDTGKKVLDEMYHSRMIKALSALYGNSSYYILKQVARTAPNQDVFVKTATKVVS